MRLLAVNTGSSSVRLALYTHDGGSLLRLAVAGYPGEAQIEDTLREFLRAGPVNAVAHRVVHGGTHLGAPCVIDATVEAEIGHLAALAPLHHPRALAWIRACRAVLGADIVQVAVFDTGFYADLPEVARSYALPRQLVQRFGLRRYGFHGIAHQALWRRWHALRPDVAGGGRVISLQLGAGCSMTAIERGVPRDTSMGFSPLEGLVMATRAGDLDPGLLLYLLREAGMTVDELDRLLSRDSGLLGMSDTSADMRALLLADAGEARLAVELYCYRARKYLGAYLAVLGGADAILLGGGVGEHAAPVREKILAGLEWAGIRLDVAANQAANGGEHCISAADSRVAVWVIPVDEAGVLVEAALAVMAGAAASRAGG
jgi:acetate kinase